MIDNELNKILDDVLLTTKVSQEQEKVRADNLLTKTDYIIKYISATFVLINAIFVFLAANKIINLFLVSAIYISISIPLCYSLFFAVRAQVLKNVKYFPTGNDEIISLRDFYDKENRMPSEIEMKNRTLNYYSEYIKSLESANNARSNLINTAYKSYLASIFLISLGLITVLIIIA